MRISDWSSDVCSSDLNPSHRARRQRYVVREAAHEAGVAVVHRHLDHVAAQQRTAAIVHVRHVRDRAAGEVATAADLGHAVPQFARPAFPVLDRKSEEHTSELQSLMRISYAVFCLKKKKKQVTYKHKHSIVS